MEHVIETRAVESTNNIHDVLNQYRSVEGSRLWYLTRCTLLFPSPRIHVQFKEIVEPLLGRINTTENYDLVFKGHC
jgi:hypothetical protein